jgi:uncharacterized protein (DUF1778 family)
MSKKMGRPTLAKGEAREEYISTRLTHLEHDEIKSAAKKSGQPKTEWVRTTLLTAARNRVTKSN